MNIALVGTDDKLLQQLKRILEGQGHSPVICADPEEALARLGSESAALLVATLPKEAAARLARGLRSKAATRRVPAIHIGPDASRSDVVELLDSGFDDSLARPFHEQIFLARVRTLLRRSSWGDGPEDPAVCLRSGDLTLNLIERTVHAGSREVALTRLEFDLLSYLLRGKDKVLRRLEILEAVWKYPNNVETRTLDKHVETLRRKLGEAASVIQTVHGVGYRLVDYNASPPAKRKR